MATLLQAQVVVIVTTGRFTQTVRTYADRTTLTTPFQVVLLDGDDLASYRSGGAPDLRTTLRSSAQHALRAKRPQVIGTLEEISADESS